MTTTLGMYGQSYTLTWRKQRDDQSFDVTIREWDTRLTGQRARNSDGEPFWRIRDHGACIIGRSYEEQPHEAVAEWIERCN